ncbi:MAG: hypothetical protein KatS3mg050_0008 [Litorilinea sp.]|nr:MAG: hypothetical protein KatS3mg050_0008 [Litorilinea sp.]
MDRRLSMRIGLHVVGLFFCTLVLTACSVVAGPPPVYQAPGAVAASASAPTVPKDATPKAELVFTPPLTGVSGFTSGREAAEQFAAHLAEASGLTITAFVPTDYGNTLLGLEQGSYDVVYLPAGFYVKARATLGVVPGYQVQVNGSTTQKGIILVAADSSIQSLEDLAGKRIAAGDLDSAASWIVPAAALKQSGVDPFGDVETFFEANDVSSVQRLLDGKVDAALVAASVLEDAKLLEANPDLAERVRTLAEFDNVPIGVIAYRGGLHDDQIAALNQGLAALAASPPTVTDADGNERSLLSLMGWDGLVPAQEDAFAPVYDAARLLGMIQ